MKESIRDAIMNDVAELRAKQEMYKPDAAASKEEIEEQRRIKKAWFGRYRETYKAYQRIYKLYMQAREAAGCIPSASRYGVSIARTNAYSDRTAQQAIDLVLLSEELEEVSKRLDMQLHELLEAVDYLPPEISVKHTTALLDYYINGRDDVTTGETLECSAQQVRRMRQQALDALPMSVINNASTQEN